MLSFTVTSNRSFLVADDMQSRDEEAGCLLSKSILNLFDTSA